MLRPLALTLFALAFGGAFRSSFAQAATAPAVTPEDQNVRTLIDGMRDASTWGHPDQFGQYKGMVAFSDHHYEAAMRLFLIGARYADKVSQLSIGLMYLNGQGVARDPVQAWAWTALSAERGYPAFEATRDRIWKDLSGDQRTEASAARDALALTYADDVAKPRMVRELRYYRSQLTGSHTGFDSGVDQIASGPSGTGSAACMRAAKAGLRAAGCGSRDLYADESWDPKIYFKARDAQFKGSVTVGALTTGKDKSASPAPGGE
ncbi:sel1 repeat family protein [Dyella sp.]|jgi:hypothetical protein|uniref:sel1 repeat family protein n=1 Tax=Dyella sp. TaxID=1869338 RepID=UPI002D78B605|nr:sel1 repeat family protein [Dyella sp.]HET6433983.1 sel1 repeat family protein [Dyella sp.]